MPVQEPPDETDIVEKSPDGRYSRVSRRTPNRRKNPASRCISCCINAARLPWRRAGLLFFGGGRLSSQIPHLINSSLSRRAFLSHSPLAAHAAACVYPLLQFNHPLGHGAFKAVFKGYDEEEGIEVAWCQVNMERVGKEEAAQIHTEVDILKSLKHQHILTFFAYFDLPNTKQIVFITEIMTSGTLKQYIHKAKRVKRKVVKKWCRQILDGLSFLHAKRIIHRDLKCAATQHSTLCPRLSALHTMPVTHTHSDTHTAAAVLLQVRQHLHQRQQFGD